MTAFKAGGALHPEEYSHIIVHRPELDRILNHIENDDLYIMLRSPRQTGKTTLLFQIMARLHGQGYGIVHLDLSGLGNLDSTTFYHVICTDIHDQISELVDVASAIPDYQQVADQIGFSNYLTRLSTQMSQARKLIIMLDEIEGIPENVSLPFFSNLRRFFHMGQRPSRQRNLYRKIMFLFSGALSLQRLSQGQNSPLRNICKPFSLDDLSRDQGHKLANHLQGYVPECVSVIADSVHYWCDGHPYLTQCLYDLIDTSEVCQAASMNQLPDAIDMLIENTFLYSDDANLIHIFNHLRENEQYHKPMRAILENQRRSVMLAEDLISIGVLKRSTNNNLVIRNRIYEKALEDFFNYRSYQVNSSLTIETDLLTLTQIDLNSATIAQLTQFPGIGLATAERILLGRPYASVDELLNVKGIGAKTLERIRGRLIVRQESNMNIYNLAIIVPLIEEFRTLRELLPGQITAPEVEDAIYYYPLKLGHPDYQAVAVVLGDMGTTPSGQVTEKVLNKIQPRMVALVGIAGSLDRDVKLGDVVVASEVNEFLASSRAVSTGADFIFEYSGRHWDVSFNLRQCVTNFEFAEREDWQTWKSVVETYRTRLNLPQDQPDLVHDLPKLHIGHLASGNTVGAAQAYSVELRGIDRKFLALEMEAAGVAQAARGRERPIEFLVVRGISDFSDHRKPMLDSAYSGGWRQYAMYSASTFLLRVLLSNSFRAVFTGLADRSGGGRAAPDAVGQTPEAHQQPERDSMNTDDSSAIVDFSGGVKIDICHRLGADWQDLADYFEIPSFVRARFDRGREPQGVWEWLEARGKLPKLAKALQYIGRHDLVQALRRPPR